MKVIGIEIDKIKAIFYVLEMDKKGNITNLTGDFKQLTLKNDMDNSSVREFLSAVHTFFDDAKPNRIAILKRQTKGRFKSAPLSFKIEGLIQCYQKIEIEFIQPMSITNYYKKNDFKYQLEFEYQEPAAKLAYYMLIAK